MPELALLVLVAVAVLMLKHTVADFFLQTSYQHLNKGSYGHPGGLLHSAIHVVLTPFVYLVLAPGSLLVAAAIAIGEFAIHYHVDWAKERLAQHQGLTTEHPAFWRALGADQLIHGLTYLGIVAILIVTAAT